LGRTHALELEPPHKHPRSASRINCGLQASLTNNHVRHKPLQTMGGNHRGYPVKRKAVARHRLLSDHLWDRFMIKIFRQESLTFQTVVKRFALCNTRHSFNAHFLAAYDGFMRAEAEGRLFVTPSPE
jgi:hypothetical protein